MLAALSADASVGLHFTTCIAFSCRGAEESQGRLRCGLLSSRFLLLASIFAELTCDDRFLALLFGWLMLGLTEVVA